MAIRRGKIINTRSILVVSAAFIACYHCNHVDRGNTKYTQDCIATLKVYCSKVCHPHNVFKAHAMKPRVVVSAVFRQRERDFECLYNSITFIEKTNTLNAVTEA